MLKVVSGPYHSNLEDAIFDSISRLKKDPLNPIAIITPTARLMEHLQAKISAKKPILNVHFHTFSSLAENIVDQGPGLPKPLLSDPFFFDYLVKSIIKKDQPFEGIRDLAVPEGFPPAVRSTLRDLLDAGAPPDVVEAVKEGFMGRDVDVGTLKELLQLYQKYLKKINELPILPRIELTREAIRLAPESTFLKQFDHLLFYGFYDLTGIQVDFFQTIVKNHKSTYFFPYVPDNEAFEFSGRFRDAVVQPVMESEIQTEFKLSDIKKSRILSTSGVRDEAWFLTHEIMRLHTDEGIGFHEMAIVSRSKERFLKGLPEALHQHHIPYRSSIKKSLSRWPQMKTVSEFLSNQDFDELKKWSEWGELCREVCEDHFKELVGQNPKIWNEIFKSIDALNTWDILEAKVSFVHYLETLKERWSQTEISDEQSSQAGVSLLYAESARGLQFKVVFLAGCEERVFPRIIREDPFLRDDARIALFNTLGYKINPKMAALKEERLLFELICQSAESHLYFLYQRTDDDGVVVGPSPYLRQYCHEKGWELEEKTESIPKPSFQKKTLFKPHLWNSQDVIAHWLDHGKQKEAGQYAKQLGRDEKSLLKGCEVQNEIQSFQNPGEYDGYVGPQNTSDIFSNGQISPTALEEYGICPFRFFARRILDLKPHDEKIDLEKLPSDQLGHFVHQFLEYFMKKMTSVQWNPAVYDKDFETFFNPIKPVDLETHPIIWTAYRAWLKEALSQFIQIDIQGLIQEKLSPVGYEKEVHQRFSGELKNYEWVGKIDRIDEGSDHVRVVDYKTGYLPDGKVIRSVVKGLKHQPPVYIMMVEKESPNKKVSFSYQQIGKDDPIKSLTPDEWKKNKELVLQTILKQIDLAHQGVFSILPDTTLSGGQYCQFCDYSSICRRNHSVSAYRALKGSGEEFIKIRGQKSKR